jgi:hypothetical protein
MLIVHLINTFLLQRQGAKQYERQLLESKIRDMQEQLAGFHMVKVFEEKSEFYILYGCEN